MMSPVRALENVAAPKSKTSTRIGWPLSNDGASKFMTRAVYIVLKHIVNRAAIHGRPFRALIGLFTVGFLTYVRYCSGRLSASTKLNAEKINTLTSGFRFSQTTSGSSGVRLLSRARKQAV